MAQQYLQGDKIVKVVCTGNNLKSFSDGNILSRLKQYIFKPDGDVNLGVGREYTVYGVLFRDNMPWYYLCDEDYDEYPTPFASDFFEVVDDQLSKYWKLSFIDLGEGQASTVLAFDEWASDRSFYERLIDGDDEAVSIFGKYRRLMEQE